MLHDQRKDIIGEIVPLSKLRLLFASQTFQQIEEGVERLSLDVSDQRTVWVDFTWVSTSLDERFNFKDSI